MGSLQDQWVVQVYGLRQFIWDCSAQPSNWKNDLPWLLGCGFHGECISVYGYTLERPMVSNDISYQVVMTSQSYYIVWVLNLEKILS